MYKKMLLLLTLLTLTVLITTSAAAQTATASLRGLVTDAQTGARVRLATIAVTPIGLERQSISSTTSATGEFEIKDLAPGSYKVTVSRLGYAEKVRSDVQIAAGETKLLEISLSPTVIQLDEVTVTASRRPEKVVEAPATVSVLYPLQIQDRITPTPTEHLKSMPTVDIVSSGLTQSNVVVRGFNNVFSGALMSLVDNRIANVPSLRANMYSLIPTVNDDIERIEVVSGPGSALYGPNSANGVMHILTRSPFDSEGTKIDIGAGQRSILMGDFRHAESFNNRLGYKISGQYYQGKDWEYDDINEPAPGREPNSVPGPYYILNGKKVSAPGRDFDVKKLSSEARLDWRPAANLTTIISGGFTRASQIELTGIGAGQAKDWTYSYYQGRLLYKNLFVQAFLNLSDAGDSFILRTGQPIIDKSRLFVSQIQHGLKLGTRQRFTYGADLLLTRPDTKGSITGRHEDNDDINEVGAYLQSETELFSKLKLVAAARIDDHNHIEDPVFSPRAALVFKPNSNHNFRVTYNRAFSTPTTNNLFLDILSAPDAFGLGSRLQPALGFSPATSVRASGVPDPGFHFPRSANGRPQFRSPFAPLAKRSTSDFIDLDEPIFTNVMWGVGRQAVLSGFLPNFKQTLTAQGMSQEQAEALSQDFVKIVPPQAGGVTNLLRTLNPEKREFVPTDDVSDVEPLKPVTTQTFETGYHGIFRNKLALMVDAYHTKIKNFIGPLVVVTPNVFLDPKTLSLSLAEQFTIALKDPKNDRLNKVLLALDQPSRGGNGNGSAVDELTTLFVAGANKNGAAFIPFGTITPKEVADSTAVMLTYRNYGNISLNGTDFSFTYYLNQTWSLNGHYSYVSKDIFKNVDGIGDIALNAPRHKFGGSMQYSHTDLGINTQLRFRYVDAFPVNSGVYVGKIDSYAVFDLNFGYDLPFSKNTRFSITVQNILNEEHQEFIGAPEIGRLIMTRLSQAF